MKSSSSAQPTLDTVSPHNQLISAKHGEILYNRFDQYIGRSIALYGEYSEAEVDLYRQICKLGDTVIEVGANTGIHTLPLAKMVGGNGHVYAFEPQRLVFQTLCANMALNSLINVSCLPFGISDKSQTIQVKEVDYMAPANFGGISIQAANQQQKTAPVTLRPLDQAVPDCPIKLLKIDVEGMELEVLKGSQQIIKQQQPIIYIENDRQEKSKELIEYLWGLDYQLYWYMPKLFNPNNYFKHQDNVFGNIVSVNMLAIPNSNNLQLTNFRKVDDSGFHPMRQ